MAIILNGDTGISSIGALSGVTSVSSASADTPVILQDSSSNSNTCRAWVNFNGTGTVAIRADFNVSSITDVGLGSYDVNFTNAMPDSNYVVCSTSSSTGGPTTAGFTYPTNTGYSTTAVRINVISKDNSVSVDPTYCNVSIFR